MSSVLSSANASNPAVKRIMREYAEFEQSYSAARRSSAAIDVVAAPLDDNLFEWHFTVRGPPSSPYAGGLYHGRVLLPSNYPFRPPDIVMLTPSGRFETGKKICLSISSYHPNNWQPSWSIRTALTALSAFFTTPAAGAIGSLDYPDREKHQLAVRSAEYVCPHCQQSNAHIMQRHSSEQLTGAGSAPQTAGEETAERASGGSGVHHQPTNTATNTQLVASRTASLPSDSGSEFRSTALSCEAPAHHPPQSTVTGQLSIGRLPLSASLARANAAQSPSAHSNSHSLHSQAPSVLSAETYSSPEAALMAAQSPSTSTSRSLSPAASTAPPFQPPPISSALASSEASTPPSTGVTASQSSTRLSVLTVSLAVLIAALLFRKLVAHLLSSHPSHASIVLHSL